MGDYNVNTINELKSVTTHIHDFSNTLSTYYYHTLINIPTRERKQSSTLLDNIIYTNIPDCYDSGMSGVLRFLTQSDHFPIFTMRNNVLTEPIKYITKRIHNQQNIALFRKYLKSANWITIGIYQIKPIFQMFMDTILQYFHLSFH